MTNRDPNDHVTPVTEVVPILIRAVWRLYYLHPCLSCGKRHYHGGGDGPEPSLGSRGGHCTLAHRPWRSDCEGEKTAGGRRECRVSHLPPGVELVLAEPDTIADFTERYRKGKVITDRQDRVAALARSTYLVRL